MKVGKAFHLIVGCRTKSLGCSRDQLGIRFATGACGERKKRNVRLTVHRLAAFDVAFRIHPEREEKPCKPMLIK